MNETITIKLPNQWLVWVFAAFVLLAVVMFGSCLAWKQEKKRLHSTIIRYQDERALINKAMLLTRCRCNDPGKDFDSLDKLCQDRMSYDPDALDRLCKRWEPNDE